MGEPDDKFVENHRNDSRPWLTNVGYGSVLRSSMKDAHGPQMKMSELDNIGIRRQRVRRKLAQEAVREIRDLNRAEDLGDVYCTTYDGQFSKEGFRVTELTQEETELHRKYPLYTAPPITFWSGALAQEVSVNSLPGMTLIRDLNAPFKRNSSFTTKYPEKFDDIEY